MKITNKIEKTGMQPMTRDRFDPGDAIMWDGGVYVVVEENKGDVFAVGLRDGVTLIEDDNDECCLVSVEVVVG